MKKSLIILAFAIYFLIGISIYKDYGLSWDEPQQRITGIVSYLYVTGKSSDLLNYTDRYYGTAFELPLVFIESHLPFAQLRDVYFLRHLITFLVFFLGVIAFYRICLYKFSNSWFALLGVGFLVLSPRIFADSFYNSKDIIFLVGFVVAIWTMVRFLDKPSYRRAIIHAAATAFVIDVRVLGVFVSVLTVAFYFYKNDSYKKFHLRTLWKNPLVLFLGLSSLLTITFWPYLWSNPIGHFFEALFKMSTFAPYTGNVLFLGNMVKASEVPWYYLPVWIAITIPISVLFLGVIGFIWAIWKIVYKQADRFLLVIFLWFLTPILFVLIAHPDIYDGWRQFYFIYPAFILLSLMGVHEVQSYIRKHFSALTKKIMFGILGVLLSINMFTVVIFMIGSHPYQNVYVNEFVGFQVARVNFDMDYWGLSFRKGLEYLAANDKSQKIPIILAYATFHQLDILPESDKRRFVLVDDPAKAKYILTNYRWQIVPDPDLRPSFYTIKVNDSIILNILKVPH